MSNCNNNRNKKPTVYTGSGLPNGSKKNIDKTPSIPYIRCLYDKAYGGDAKATADLVNIYCGRNPTRGDIYNNPTRENLQIMYEVLIHSNPKNY